MSFDFFADLTISDGPNADAIKRAVEDLINTEVLVGIPEEEGAREGGPSNALLLYWHTNGAPRANIPPRPIIEPAIEDASERIGTIMGEAAEAALDGDTAGMTAALEKAGRAGQDAAQTWFLDPKNGWPKLKKATIAARDRKARKAAKAEKKVNFKTQSGNDVSFTAYKGTTLNSDPKPLIDTGELRRAITYIVRKKE
jgi:hypothetical protein